MKILISAPSGFNSREILHPLAPLLTLDPDVETIFVISPASPHHEILFKEFGMKFEFYENPSDTASHLALLKKLQPDIVLTPTFGLDDKDTPILEAAKTAGIKTCVFVSSWDNVYKMERFKNQNKQYILPDCFAVWNKMMKSHIQALWPEFKGEINITGAPRFDFFFQQDRIPDRQSLLKRLELPTTQAKLVHLATTELYPFDYIVKAIASGQSKALIKYELQLFASVHPGGDLNKHKQYKQYGVRTQFALGRRGNSPLDDFRYMPLYDEIFYHVSLFKNADLLINQSSTVAIESMLTDTPVINVKYGRKWDWWNWHRSMVYRDFQQHYKDIIEGGGTTIVNSDKELISAINAYLEDPSIKRTEREQTVKKLLTYTDGKSALRLKDYLKQIITS